MRQLALSLVALILSTAGPAAQLQAATIQTPNQKGTPLLSSSFLGTAPGANAPWLSTGYLDPGIAYSGWDLGPGIIGSSAVDDAFGIAVTAGLTESTLSEALATDSYASFTIQPTAGGSLDLDGVRMRLGVRRVSWNAPRRYALFSSVAGFNVGSELFVSPYLESWNQWENVWDSFIPASGYGAIQGATEFRLYSFAGNFGDKVTSITQFSMTADLTTVTLNLTSGMGGVTSVSPASPLYQQGQTVQLHATPDPGFRFAGWSDGIVGFGNPRVLQLDTSMQVHGSFEPVPAPRMSVGTNLGGITDWSSSWVFSDLFRRTRTWLTTNADGTGAWDTGLAGEIPVDSEGYPHSIPFTPTAGGPPQKVHTILIRGNESGPHRILYEGTGTFRFQLSGSPSTQVVATGPPSEVAIQLPADVTLSFVIDSSAAAPGNLRNIRIVADAQLGSYATDPFHPLFMASLGKFDHLRFMDWGVTNGSYVQDWNTRTLPTNYTQAAPAGASLELQVDLANRLMKDAWFCVPHRATDNYVREMARLVRDTLDPSLLAYIEYSNETWNTQGSFTQTAYVQQMGLAQGLSTTSWDAGQFFAAKRSAEIWEIFDQEFGAAARTRLSRVLATHAASTTTTQLRISALNNPSMNPTHQHADTLAIAPYFGSNFAPSVIPPSKGTRYPSVSDLLKSDAPMRVAEAIAMAASQKTIANLQGMDLICYEGGQHYVTIYGAENDPAMVQILQDVNRNELMYELYTTYLDGLKAAGVEAFANFSHCGEWSKWGSWGTLESIDQPLASAPKFRALVDWIVAQ